MPLALDSIGLIARAVADIALADQAFTARGVAFDDKTTTNPTATSCR